MKNPSVVWTCLHQTTQHRVWLTPGNEFIAWGNSPNLQDTMEVAQAYKWTGSRVPGSAQVFVKTQEALTFLDDFTSLNDLILAFIVPVSILKMVFRSFLKFDLLQEICKYVQIRPKLQLFPWYSPKAEFLWNFPHICILLRSKHS